jgi:hypothetical protein
MADKGTIYIGYIFRQELKIYAYSPDKVTNEKAFHLHLRFTHGCGSIDNVLSIDFSAYQQCI